MVDILVAVVDAEDNQDMHMAASVYCSRDGTAAALFLDSSLDFVWLCKASAGELPLELVLDETVDESLDCHVGGQVVDGKAY